MSCSVTVLHIYSHPHSDAGKHLCGSQHVLMMGRSITFLETCKKLIVASGQWCIIRLYYTFHSRPSLEILVRGALTK